MDALNQKHLQAALQWLENSIKATNNRGSAAYYHLWRGWASAYPETTGYLIETLLAAHQQLKEEKYLHLALDCAYWLLDLQQQEGSFPGGLIGSKTPPQVFDTGQIVFGLVAAYEQTEEQAFLDAADRACAWLTTLQDPSGCWKKGGLYADYTPAYYARVVWAMLLANRHLQKASIEAAALKAYAYFQRQWTEKHSIKDWGFAPNAPALTHTIAYTLRGLWESAVLLEDKTGMEAVRKALHQLQRIYGLKNRLAGAYDLNWQGNERFICLTGHCQLSILLRRVGNQVQEADFSHFSKILLENALSRQCHFPVRGIKGALPGSWPIWGAYMPLRFPNWGLKFLVEALLM
ncbi:MAG TPA: hypothetical protein PKA00_16995 [Saprospiraceae bacterium]|nr:hypothetical protein [Saprospiraceae bacterium]HMQ84616.1 hypothetical protein [Saprospiraceae bacterium]